MRKLLLFIAAALGAGLLSSCTQHTPTAPLNYTTGALKEAYAVIRPVDGGDGPHGEAWFKHEKRFLRVVVRLQNLEPNSSHGIQIDTLGGCAGRGPEQVYDPQGHYHAGPAAIVRRVGNLGNVTADGDGKVEFHISLDNASLAGKEHTIMGRSLTINAQDDDLKSDLYGGLGAIVACGVIGVVEPPEEKPKVWYTKIEKPREDIVPESLMWYVPEAKASESEADGKNEAAAAE